MAETIVVLVVVSIAAVLVFLKARERLRSPGARRSRRDRDGADSFAEGRHDRHDASDGGDGGGGD